MVPTYSPEDLRERSRIANFLLTHSSDNLKVTAPRPGEILALAMLPRDLEVQFPAGMAPEPQEGAIPDPNKALPKKPKIDVVVVTYTQPEADALAHVLTPGVRWSDWHAYSHNFSKEFRRLIGPGNPSALKNQRLGLFFRTKVGKKNVLVMKSDLHLKRDIKMIGGKPTHPIADLFRQIIKEVEPETFLTIGTSGGVYPNMRLGDVVVTRAARFECQDEFKSAKFNHERYKSDWKITPKRTDVALELMQLYKAQLTVAPTSKPDRPNPSCTPNPGVNPTIYFDGQGEIPAFHPVLTTDYFEYGTTTNKLYEEGVAVEMDDAVLGMVCKGLKSAPHWAVVRNLSDPIIDGNLPRPQPTQCAVFYYDHYGDWTSVMGALATWSIIMGL